MQEDRKTVRTSKGLREYTCLGCPLTRNRTAWCFRLCTPDDEGNGRCGRIAPHSLKGRTQLSVEHYGRRMQEAHFENLERLYLAAPANEYLDAGVRIAEGSAEIVIPVQEKFVGIAGAVHDGICFTAMADSAALAANSVVQKALLLAVTFEIHLTRPLAAAEIIARSRFLGMSGEQYLAESVLLDSEGKELGTGSGAFVESEVSLSSAP